MSGLIVSEFHDKISTPDTLGNIAIGLGRDAVNQDSKQRWSSTLSTGEDQEVFTGLDGSF